LATLIAFSMALTAAKSAFLAAWAAKSAFLAAQGPIAFTRKIVDVTGS
jgi:hypothetical protein